MTPPRLLSQVNFPPRPRGAPRSLCEHSEPSPPCGRARLGRGAAAGGASPPPPHWGGGWGVGDNIILPTHITTQSLHYLTLQKYLFQTLQNINSFLNSTTPTQQ